MSELSKTLSKISQVIQAKIEASTLRVSDLKGYHSFLDSKHREECEAILEKCGFIKAVSEVHENLGSKWHYIEDYAFDDKKGLISIELKSGNVIRSKLGSIERILSDMYGIKKKEPAYYLAMVYLFGEHLETTALAKAIEENGLSS